MATPLSPFGFTLDHYIILGACQARNYKKRFDDLEYVTEKETVKLAMAKIGTELRTWLERYIKASEESEVSGFFMQENKTLVGPKEVTVRQAHEIIVRIFQGMVTVLKEFKEESGEGHLLTEEPHV